MTLLGIFSINPQHTVPTLVDGDFVIWDSHAIAAYLVSKYAADDSFYPRDLQKRALVDQRLHFDSSILFPAMVNTITPILRRRITSFPAERLEDINKGYEFTDTFLVDRPWLAGEQLTIADICAVASISTLHLALPVNPEKYPNLSS